LSLIVGFFSDGLGLYAIDVGWSNNEILFNRLGIIIMETGWGGEVCLYEISSKWRLNSSVGGEGVNPSTRNQQHRVYITTYRCEVGSKLEVNETKTKQRKRKE